MDEDIQLSEIKLQVEIPGLDGVFVTVPVDEMIDEQSPYVGGLPFPLDRWGKKELDTELFTLVRYWQERALQAEFRLEGLDK